MYIHTHTHTYKNKTGIPRKDPRPWEVDGFTKEEKDDLSQWQWSRYDGEAYARNSSTISFKRK
jgi:hypothetical protein